MRKDTLRNVLRFAGALAIASTIGCLGGSARPSDPGTDPGSGTDPGNGTTPGGTDPGNGGTTPTAPAANPLDSRVVDYNQALRTAALKLVGRLPTLDEMFAVTDQATYEAQIDAYLAMPEFTRQIFSYYQDMMKLGGSRTFNDNNVMTTVSFETAPAFAAKLAVDGSNQMTMFTATTGTCGTYDPLTMSITAADCAAHPSGLAPAGILTDQGAMLVYNANMAFRRAKWVQYSFACSKFPAEFSTTAPVPFGNGLLTIPGGLAGLNKIAGKNVTYGGNAMNAVDFHDASGVVCANCHTTLNPLAPLFANFDGRGRHQTDIQVRTPLGQVTKLTDWLPAGQSMAWRNGVAATNLSELGAALAADPAVHRCQVSRAWNWAMGKLDITEEGATVPDSTIAAEVAAFTAGGFKMKLLLKSIFTNEDFVKF